MQTYNASADSVLALADPLTANNDEPMQTVEASEQDPANGSEKKKKKKKKREGADKEDTFVATDITEQPVTEDTGKKEKKEKKKKKKQLDENAELQSVKENIEAEGKKKKKRKHSEPDEVETESLSIKKEKKKKRKSND